MPDPVQHFEIYGDDPEKLGTFYKEVFDWKIEKSQGVEGYWLISTGPTDTQGQPTQPGTINGGLMQRPMPDARAWMNYVTVKSLEEALGLIQRQGGKVMRPRSVVPNVGYFAIVTDPEGNHFGIWENDERAS